jgi:hypothetical protein
MLYMMAEAPMMDKVPVRNGMNVMATSVAVGLLRGMK